MNTPETVDLFDPRSDEETMRRACEWIREQVRNGADAATWYPGHRLAQRKEANGR